MRVDKSKARTANEEYTYWWKRLDGIGDGLVWELHPNEIRMATLRTEKCFRKMKEAVDSEDFEYYSYT